MTLSKDLINPAETLMNFQLEKWKEKGGRIVAYYCPFVPEELLVAAGIVPFAMRAPGSTTSELGDQYAHSMTCSLVRHFLDEAMRGSYEFIDGFVATNCCDPFRRMFDVWEKGRTPIPKKDLFLQLLSIPRKTEGEGVFNRLRNELFGFKRNLEEYFNVSITDEKLRDAIKVCNESRRLIGELYDLRKQPNPPISGEDALRIMIASESMPKEEFNNILSQLLSEVKSEHGTNGKSARLLLIGGMIDNPEYVKIIEEAGGLIVADYTCNGLMNFINKTDEELPPIDGIVQKILGNYLCPRMLLEHKRRFEFIGNLCREYNVDGVVFQRLMFCDLWGGAGTMLQWNFKEAGIPALHLEREYALSGIGQMRTRVQAFLETIGR